jgi:polysaccharide biosynthesis/export protein
MSMANGQLSPSRAASREVLFPVGEGGHSDRELLERFVHRKDETAFRTLVQRYGPMVLAICRRVLDHEQDAEDAFQATFLVLARRAAALENPDLLGGWLHGVAHRIARKARAQTVRRRAQERRAAAMTGAEEPQDGLAMRELCAALDEELNQLPDKYRLPLVLCYLQGLTNEEAARRLGWPAGSISYRLARGRERLRQRMRARGREAPAGVFAVLLALEPGAGSLPGGLVDTTVRAAGEWTATQAGATALVSERVAGLVEAALGGFGLRRKLLLALPWALAAALALGGAALFASGGFSRGAQPAPARPGCCHTP